MESAQQEVTSRPVPDWRIGDRSRENTALQNLSSKRNWCHCMLRGSIGMLCFMRKWWPTVDIQRAVWALESVEEQIDAVWWDTRLALKKQQEEHEDGR